MLECSGVERWLRFAGAFLFFACMAFVLTFLCAHDADAATTVAGSNAAPGYIDSSSNVNATIALIITDDAGGNLISVNVTLTSVAGFTTTDLAALASDQTSGVQLWQESGATGGFQAGEDTFISCTNGDWLGTGPWAVNMTLSSPAALPSTTMGSNFYIVIRTSATIANGDMFSVSIEVGAISSDQTGYGNVPTSAISSSTITADTQAPTGTQAIAESEAHLHYPGAGNIIYFSNAMGGPETFTVTVTPSDSGSGVSAVVFGAAFNVSSPVTYTAAPYTQYYGVDVAHTSCTITITIYDNVGNQCTLTVICVEDTTPPSGFGITASADSDGDSHGGTDIAPDIGYDDDSTIGFELTGTATDAQSDLPTNRYRYQLDSGTWSAWTNQNTQAYTVTSDGTHTCNVQVTDNVGNVNTMSADIVVDRDMPMGTFTIIESPASPYIFYNSGTSTFYYSNMMGTTLQPFIFSAVFTYTGAAPAWKMLFGTGFNQSATFFDLTSPYERMYAVNDTHTNTSLTVTLYDRAGNSQILTMICVKDTTAPAGYGISPVADADNHGGTDIAPDTGYDDDHSLDFAVTGTATDLESGIPTACYSFRLGAGAWTANASASSNTFPVGSDGSYTGYVRVIDNVGNFATSPPSASIISDTHAPVGTFGLTEASPYLFYNSSTTTLFYSALMGMTAQTFDLTATITNGDNSGWWKIAFSGGFDLTPQTYTTNMQTRTYGVVSTHSTTFVTITIYNHAGNSALFNIACVKDTTAPSGYTLAPVADSDSHGGTDINPDVGYDDDLSLSYEVTGSIIEANSGLPNNPITYRINGGAWSAATSSTMYTYSAASSGTYQCEVKITDNVGNYITTYLSATIVADTSAPTGSYVLAETSPYLYFVLASNRLYYSALMGTTAQNFDITATYDSTGISGAWKVRFSAGFDQPSFDDSASPYVRTYGVIASHNTQFITITMFNHAGNSFFYNITCVKDTTPPSGYSFASVPDLDSHGGDHIDPAPGYDDDTDISFRLGGTATDGESGLPANYISYRLDAGAWSPWTSSTTQSYTVASSGSYICYLNVTDNVGNYQTYMQDSIIVDTANPAGTITIVETPTSPYIYYNSGTGIFYYSDMMGTTAQNFDLVATFTSAGFSMAWQVKFSTGFSRTSTYLDTSFPYSQSYGVLATHTTILLYAVLYNHAGNAVNLTITCIEDTTAPSGYGLEHTPDSDSDGGNDIAPDIGYDDDHTLDFRITGTITETSSGLPSSCYSYKLNSGNWSDWSSTPTVVYNVASDGTYVCSVNITDNVGNVATVVQTATVVSDTVHPTATYTLVENPSSPYLYYNAGTGVFYYSDKMGGTSQPFDLSTSFGTVGVSGEWRVVYSAGFNQASSQTILAPATYSRTYGVTNVHTTTLLTITLYNHAGNAVRLSITCTKDVNPPTGFTIANVPDSDNDGGDDITPNSGYADDSTISFQFSGGSDALSGLPTDRYSYMLDGGPWSAWGSSSSSTYTSLADGLHTCDGRMIDNVGNVANVPTVASMIIDTDMPMGCNISVTEGGAHIYLNSTSLFYTSLTSGETFTITANFGDAGNSLAWKVAFSAGFDRSAFEDTSSPFSGLYTIQPAHTTSLIKVVFYNNAGNSMTLYLPCIKDSTAPTLTMGALQPYYTTSIFTVSWSATDNAGGAGMCDVSRYDVEYNDNGAGYTTWKSGTMQTSDTFTGWNGHTYTFRARARDNVNNTCAYVSTITTMIDTSLPTSQVNALPAYSNTSDIVVSWTCNDPSPGSGVARVYIQVRVDDGTFTDWFPGGVTNSSATFHGLDGHRYYFQCIAVDNASNSEVYPGLDGDTSTFVDTLAPAVPTMLSPADNPSFSIANAIGSDMPTFTWSSPADPGGSGVEHSTLEVYSSSNPLTPIETIDVMHGSPAPSYSADCASVLCPGNYTWRIRDTDRAGNVGSWTPSWSFRVDARPSVAFMSPIANAEYKGNVAISWLATDPDADNLGMLTVSVYYNTASNASAPGWMLIEGAQTDGNSAWNSLLAPDGSYYLMLIVNDTVLANYSIEGPIIIKNYNITLVPDQIEKRVDPGATVTFAVNASNYGTIGYDLALTLGNVPGWTISLSVPSLFLAAGQAVTFMLYATAPLDGLEGDTAYVQVTGSPEDTGGAGGCSIGVRAVINHIEDISVPSMPAIFVDPGEFRECLVWFENSGNGPDSFAISFSNELGWTASISNGTLVGPICAHGATALLLNVSVPSNAFAYASCNTTITLTSSSDSSVVRQAIVQMVVRQVARFSVTSPSNMTAGPHTIARFTFGVQNTGNGYDVFEITAGETAINSWSIQTNDSESIAPGSDGTVVASVTIPPSISEGISDTFMATIRSRANGTAHWEGVFSVTVVAGYGVIISCAQQEIEVTPGQPTQATIECTNAGNVVDGYIISASTTSRWTAQLSSSQLSSISSSAKGYTTLTIIGPTDGFAGENTTITLLATSQGMSSISDTLRLTVRIRLVVNMTLTGDAGKRANPSANVTYNVTLKNTGNGLEIFQLSFECSLPGATCAVVSGATPSGIAAGKYNASIAMGETSTICVAVYLPSSASGQDVLTVIATSTTNLARTASVTITTLVNQGPIPVISSYNEGAMINAGCSNAFNSTATDPENDEIVAFLWDFGDGKTASTQNSEHTYELGGRYTVTLTATDALGRSTSVRLGIVVNGVPTIAVVSPTAASPTVIEEHTLTFQISTFDPENDQLTQQWTIDGRSAGTGKTLKYTPQMSDAEKTHTIRLTVSDPYSQIAMEWQVKVMKDSSILASRNIWLVWLILALSLCMIGAVIAYNNRMRLFGAGKKRERKTTVVHATVAPSSEPMQYTDHEYPQAQLSSEPQFPQQSNDSTFAQTPTQPSQAQPVAMEPRAKRAAIKIVKEHVDGATAQEMPLEIGKEDGEALPDLPDIDELIQLPTAETAVESPAMPTETPSEAQAEPAMPAHEPPKTEELAAILATQDTVETPITPPAESKEDINEQPQPPMDVPPTPLPIEQQGASPPQPQYMQQHEPQTQSPPQTQPFVEQETKIEQIKDETTLPVQLIKFEDQTPPHDALPQSAQSYAPTEAGRFEHATEIQAAKTDVKKPKPKIVAEIAPSSAVALPIEEDSPKAKSKPKIVGESKGPAASKPKIAEDTEQREPKRISIKPVAPPKKIEIKPVAETKAPTEQDNIKEDTKEINKSLQSLLEECNSMLSTISTYQSTKDDKKDEKKL